jgi:hypothetical protein
MRFRLRRADRGTAKLIEPARQRAGSMTIWNGNLNRENENRARSSHVDVGTAGQRKRSDDAALRQIDPFAEGRTRGTIESSTRNKFAERTRAAFVENLCSLPYWHTE